MWTVSSPTQEVSAHAERAALSCTGIKSNLCIFLDWFSAFLKVKVLAERYRLHVYDKRQEERLESGCRLGAAASPWAVAFYVSDILNCTAALSAHMCLYGRWADGAMETGNWKSVHPSSYSSSGSWRKVGGYRVHCVPMQVRAFITLEETNVFRRDSPVLEGRFHRSSVQSNCMGTGI